MKNQSLNLYELPFWKDLFYLGEAMQYAFHGRSNSEYAVNNRAGWTKTALSLPKQQVCEQIQSFKSENAERLAKSPILLGMMDTYLAAAETKDPEQLRNIYTAFQNMQRDYKFDKHKAEYIEAGCVLSTGYLEEKGLHVSYPIFLYGAYAEKGGSDDDHRGGYLYPVHKLTDKEIREIHDIRPQLFERSESVRRAYEAMENQPGGPN